MLEKGDRVLVGVSGGPDSIFLLDALLYLKKRLGIGVYIANMDHGIRGKASAADSRFVMNKAKKLKIRCFHDKINLKKPGLAGNLSTEEVLRHRRYKFFIKSAKSIRAKIIATGHTLDDQAETVLMRVIKGSTIKGLTGIPPKGEHGGIRVVRPLIEIEKSRIVDFLDENSIRYRLDRTNTEERFLRNAIRKRILPFLEKYNPRLKRSLALMSESLREDRQFIEDRKRLETIKTKKNGKRLSIALKDIVVQPKALRREIVRDALANSGGNIKKLTFRHWQDVDTFLKHKRNGQSIDLPGGVMIKRDNLRITFEKR